MLPGECARLVRSDRCLARRRPSSKKSANRPEGSDVRARSIAVPVLRSAAHSDGDPRRAALAVSDRVSLQPPIPTGVDPLGLSGPRARGRPHSRLESRRTLGRSRQSRNCLRCLQVTRTFRNLTAGPCGTRLIRHGTGLFRCTGPFGSGLDGPLGTGAATRLGFRRLIAPWPLSASGSKVHNGLAPWTRPAAIRASRAPPSRE